MTGVFSWKSILEYVSSYNPLDSGVDSAHVGFASIGFALSAFLSGHSTAKYGYLGHLVLFIQKQGMHGLRTSVIFANFQRGLGALFRVFLVYIAKFRMGLARMTLYTYATFISGSQLLWVSPSKRRYRRLFLVAQLSMLGAGYAGEGSTSYIFNTQLKKAEEKSRKNPVNNGPPTTTGGTDPLLIEIWVRGTHKKTIREAREVLRTFCYQKLSWTEKENTAEEMDSVARQLQPQNARKMRNRIRKKLFAAKLPGTILGTVLAAVFSTEVFIKISTAVAIISYNLFFWMGAQYYDLGEMENYDKKDEEKIDRKDKKQILDAVSELKKAVEAAVETVVDAVLQRLLSLPTFIISFKPRWAKSTWGENKSGEKEKQDKKDEEKIDGKDEKQNPDALVPDLKNAVEAALKLFPLWLIFASTCYLVNATGDSFFMEQVDYLENNTESVKIPKCVFYFFSDIVSIITGQVSYYLVEQFYDEKKDARWARLLRISIGMLFSSLCCIVASLVAYRLDSNYNSASMLWLLPQFLLWGMMKGILEEGLEEFLHPDHPDNDLEAIAVCGIAEAVGYFLRMILTAASPSSWVGSGSDISKSHLGNYYRTLAIITLFSTFLFTIVAIACELREKVDKEKGGKKG